MAPIYYFVHDGAHIANTHASSSLSRVIRELTRDFETRTASGSELFSLITRLHTITFTMLSTFSRLWMISVRHHCPGTRNVLFRLPSASQKRACLSSLKLFESYRFQTDSWFRCGRAKMLHVDAILLKNGDNKLRFQTNKDSVAGPQSSVFFRASLSSFRWIMTLASDTTYVISAGLI